MGKIAGGIILAVFILAALPLLFGLLMVIFGAAAKYIWIILGVLVGAFVLAVAVGAAKDLEKQRERERLKAEAAAKEAE